MFFFNMFKRRVVYKRRECVGIRQMYRRINESVQNIENELGQIPVRESTKRTLIENVSTRNDSCEEINNSFNECFSQDVCHSFSFDGISENLVTLQSVDSINQNCVRGITSDACDLRAKLKVWAVTKHVSQSSVNELLHILQPLHPSLPLDCRTLVETPINVKTTKLESGEYCHFGLSKALCIFLSKCKHFTDSVIKISFNVDGLPLFHSSTLQLWPILGLVTNIKCQPFVIGVFCGKSKPKPLDLYLHQFLSDLQMLLNEGLEYENKHYDIEIHSFVCDAPARAFLKCIKSHGGYSSCEKCHIPGNYVHGKVILRGTRAVKRTDHSFAIQLDEDHHLGTSPLSRLPVGLVSHFPIDYMHCVCLGVVRKLLNTWISGDLSVRLPGRLVNEISNRLLSIRNYFPKEFNRKPRSLSEIARWKASEFRSFLLYAGPIVLFNVTDLAIYEHFLLLHSAITILLSKLHIARFSCQFASSLLNMFVNHSEEIYGIQFLVHNVHTLCHLGDDAERYGPLDSFSAFPFENHLGQLKSLVKGKHRPLQQLFRRLTEADLLFSITTFDSEQILFKLEHNSGPLINNEFSCKQYKKFVYFDVEFCINSYSFADSYCMSKQNDIIQIQNVVLSSTGDSMLVGKKFLSCKSLYNYPIQSDLLNIHIVKQLSHEIFTLSISDIQCKCLVTPFKHDWVCFPLIHSML